MKSFKLLWIGLLLTAVLAACSPAPEAVNEAVVTTSSSNSMGSNSMNGSRGEQPEAVVFDEDDEDDEPLGENGQQAIQILLGETAVSEFLATYPDWAGDAWPENEEETIWGVDLYSDAADEWLGWGEVNIETGEILEYFVPRDLSAEEFQAGLAEVEAFVLNDAEILARLGNAVEWERDTYYDRWEQLWEIYFYKGLDEIVVIVYRDEEGMYLEEIANPNQLEVEEQAEFNRNQAIELAYEAEGIDQALDGSDNWVTFVADQGNSQWLVEFVADEELQFYALVDITNRQILESGK